MLLADELVKRPRPHARGQRAVKRRYLVPRLLRLLGLEQLVHTVKVASGPLVRVSLLTVLREWGRLGLIGFGGPPAHVVLLRELVVERHGWIDAREFEDANAACQLLPGPGSTQLAIYCGLRVGGLPGALVGGFGFIVPGLLMVLAIAALALGDAPPAWILGVGSGAGAAVVAVVIQAGFGLGRSSLAGRRDVRGPLYVVAGFAAVVVAGPYVVVVLLGAGLLELAWRRRAHVALHAWPVALVVAASGASQLPALAWTALKVGALSYGGGFVTIPLMQEDAVERHDWMSHSEFLNAVAFGQLTPGPVTHTVSLVGWAAAGLLGALVASAIAFAPSFLAILLGGEHFGRLRENQAARAFLDGAGPAAVGAILGAAVPLAMGLEEWWQLAVLAGAALLLLLDRAPLWALGGGALAGLVVALSGGPLP
jgi:chromate transporter